MKYALLIILLFLPSAQPAALPACSTAQHDRYRATGPDGKLYPTWHPQVDLSQGCVFDHEHGSNPALARPGYAPLYGYSAMGMSEGHSGFKGYAFQVAGYRYYMLNHQGTASASLAACTRMHTLDIAVWDANNTLVADLHLMGDFGRAVANETGVALTPPACPDQASIGSSTGVRQMPAAWLRNIGYEPWRVDSHPLPFWVSGALTFNTSNPQTACDTLSCTVSLRRTDLGGAILATGAWRFLTLNSTSYGLFRIHATEAYSGAFAYGGAAQFIQPGLDVSLPAATCRPFGQDYWYDCSGAAADELPYRRNPFVMGAN